MLESIEACGPGDSARAIRIFPTPRHAPLNRNRNHTRDTLASKHRPWTQLVRRTLSLSLSLPLRYPPSSTCTRFIHAPKSALGACKTEPEPTPTDTNTRDPISPPSNGLTSWAHLPIRIAHTGRPQSTNGLFSLEIYQIYPK